MTALILHPTVFAHTEPLESHPKPVAVDVVLVHTELVESHPGVGEVVEKRLETIELIFTEATAEITIILIKDNVEYHLRVEISRENPARVVGHIDSDADELTEGVYQVLWRARSAVDNHSISGSYNFEYQPPSSIPYELIISGILTVLAIIVGILVYRRLPARETVSR